MRIALISDIHANAVALRAVLADIDRIGVDGIVCLGDVATLGPRPQAVIEILDRLGCPCIMGNHDEFLVQPTLIDTYCEKGPITEAVAWCQTALAPAELEFIGGFERSLQIPLERDATLLVFHGSPRSHMDDLLATTPADELDRLLAGHGATVMAGGHTHIQMLRQHRGTLLVNPGSVGLPFREYVAGKTPTVLAHAEYAMVEVGSGGVSVDLRRVALDRDTLRTAAAASLNPMRELLVRQYS